jgi:beta-phosphoglucomutase
MATVEKTNEAIKNLDLKIKTDNILFFDMDGTLVDTNFANYLSYKKAIKSVIQSDTNIAYSPSERFNRRLLNIVVPNLTNIDYDKIIQQKEVNYKDELPHSKLNKSVADILIQYSKTNKTVLVTNCREDRALMTLDYHGLTDKFSNLYFRQFSNDNEKINKFKNAILSLNISPNLVVVFENEEIEIQDAITAGIPSGNILFL